MRAVRSEPVERVSADEIARIWGVSARRVRKFCQEGRVFAARKVDGVWTIPVTAERSVDGRDFAVLLPESKVLPPKAFSGSSIKSSVKVLEEFATDRMAPK